MGLISWMEAPAREVVMPHRIHPRPFVLILAALVLFLLLLAWPTSG